MIIMIVIIIVIVIIILMIVIIIIVTVIAIIRYYRSVASGLGFGYWVSSRGLPRVILDGSRPIP